MTALRLSVGMLGLSLVLCALPGLAQAQSSTRSVSWRHFDVQIDLQPDGSFNVAERQEVDFHGSFSQAQRTIPLARLAAIDNVRVGEETNGSEVPYAPGSSQPHTFSTAQSGTARTISWRFDPVTDATRTFVVHYTVRGGVRIYDAGDQVWWKAIYAERPGPIEASSVQVHLPADVAAGELKLAWYREPANATSPDDLPSAGGGQSIDARTVRFDTGALAANEGAEVRVQLPHGLLQAPPPPWQAEVDQQEWVRTHLTPIANFVAVLLAAAILSGSIAVWAVSWSRARRDQNVGPVPPLLDQPPSDLPAPVVGTLVDGRPQTRDAVAALVDMAQRGLLRLAPTTSAGMLLIPLVGRTDDVRLRDYEHALLRALYGTSEISQPLDLAAARGRFARGLLAVRRALMDTLVGAGLFEHAPLLRLGSFRWLGAVLAFVGFIVGVQGQPAPLLGVAPAARLVGLALIVAGLLLHFGGRAGARRTLTGALEAKRWQAFERFLTKSADTAAWRDEYLPYAIAFGLDRAWLQRLEAAQRPMPGWYDATYSPSTPTYVGVTPADSTGSTAYVAGGAPPSFSLPSPQAWSDSLANLLDSASTTLASAGSSSSGGSGSSSDFGSSSGDGGGGFSGGGDSGGDGGGGGSGSFS